MEELGLKLSIYQIKMRNKKMFDAKHHQALKAKETNKFSKGARIKKPEENEELRIEDLQFLQKIKSQRDQMISGETPDPGQDLDDICEEGNYLDTQPLEEEQTDLAADLLSIDNMTIKDGIRKFTKMQLSGQKNREAECDFGSPESYREELHPADDGTTSSHLQYPTESVRTHEGIEDSLQKKLKKSKENLVEINPELPIEDYINQGGKISSKESMTRAEMKNIGIHDNNDLGNDYIMKKIEELTSAQNRSSSKSLIVLENRGQEKTQQGKSTDSQSKTRKVFSTIVSQQTSEASKPHITEIDMSDNIFLAHKNPDLVRKRQEEILQQKLSRQAIPEDPNEDQLALNDLE